MREGGLEVGWMRAVRLNFGGLSPDDWPCIVFIWSNTPEYSMSFTRKLVFQRITFLKVIQGEAFYTQTPKYLM